jgi:hypothetical protein
MALFPVRFLIACVFSVAAALAHQQSAFAAAILLAGTRSLLAFTPLITLWLQSYDLIGALCIALVGNLLSHSGWQILGTSLMALGFSVAGFIIKSVAAETPRSSALNKIAITSGHAAAGLCLWILVSHPDSATWIPAVLLSIALCIAWYSRKSPRRTLPRTEKTQQGTQTIGWIHGLWLFFGIAIGIRVFGIYAVLPYHLLQSVGILPDWYGMIFTGYAIAVILTQLPAALLPATVVSLPVAIGVLGLSCLILGLPSVFHVESFGGALLWCGILALEEIFAPYIDFHAAKSRGGLIIKELSIGLGGALCMAVFHYGYPWWLSAVALLSIGLGMVCHKALTRPVEL